MPELELHDLPVREAGKRLRDGRLTSEGLTRHALDRIRRFDSRINAFVHLTVDRALEDARQADRELAAGGDRGPMHGIPVALKDLYETAGIRTTCCSKVMRDNVPTEDSEVARRLSEGGAVLLGKLTTSEFAMASPDFGLPFPPARNPWNTDHVPGGSSSGSGASIAARFIRVSMGSDTTGSVRAPAGACGVVGLKPTYGRISLRGIYPLAYSLDTPGPLGRTVEDTAVLLQVTAGYDPADPASVDTPVPDYLNDLEKGVEGLRIAWPRRFISSVANPAPEVIPTIEEIVRKLIEAGAEVREIDFPNHELCVACAHVIMLGEAFEIHSANLRERAVDYGVLTGPRTMIGAAVSASDYIRAQRLRREIGQEVNTIWNNFDALIGGGNFSTARRMDAPYTPYAGGSQDAVFSLCGSPAVSVPVRLVKGLPLGITIASGPFNEVMALRISRAVERLSGWSDQPLPELG